ncbi:MAG: hypothetical protein KKF48_04800 [Nanoarchaeota archaeon]|nr:hypothetical protein [Nanoarchaeota archaeon]MBU1028336.1 hypothetical protein [Nanoarchaeota archaeon]
MEWKRDKEEENKKELEEKIKNNLDIEQNKTLKKIFVFLGVFILIITLWVIFINSTKHFEYRGITGNVIKEGELIFYQTTVPMKYQGEWVDYNIFLRNSPKSLERIPFDGEINLLHNMVLESEEEFSCDGKGIISIVNLKNLYNVVGTKVIKDENATCDPEGRYMFLRIQNGDVTSIEQVGPACYNLNVNNCEILEVTEKFMVETLVKANEIVNENKENFS